MLNKVTYTEGVTLIHAQNLNEIQDAIIENEGDIDGLQTDVGGLQTDVGNLQGQVVFTAPDTDGTYVLKVTVEDGTATYAWVEEQVEPEQQGELENEGGN